jgi:hypothetical protein
MAWAAAHQEFEMRLLGWFSAHGKLARKTEAGN